MALQQGDKEVVAGGGSSGAFCRPCIEHIPAGRDARLSELKLGRAVAAAEANRRSAMDVLRQRSHELLSGQAPPGAVVKAEPVSRLGELVALGASIGGNCRPLPEQHVAGARSAIKMAEIGQQHAAGVTVGKQKRPLRQPG